MSSGLILNVNFNEKDEAKALGARWSARLKKWYIPSNIDIAPFSRWIPQNYEEGATYALTPLYLVCSMDVCWKCKAYCNVYCLAAEGFETEGYFYENTFVKFSELVSAPPALSVFLQKTCPSYHLDYSHTVGARYFMNHCACGAKLGDFFLHSEPDGGFYPTSVDAAQNIVLHPIDFLNQEHVLLDAGYSLQEPDLIAEYARRL